MVKRISPIDSVTKRSMDLFLGLFAIVMLAPLLAMLSLMVAVFIGRPIFFRQLRPGLNGLSFTLYKFRTMTEKKDECGELLPDRLRLTRLGAMLRGPKSNWTTTFVLVVKGEMSLIGPRPLLLQYMPYYTEREYLRNTVRPGITGWAQVWGRNTVSWDQRLEMDVWYIENWSILLDIRILFRTIITVIRKEGVSVDSYEIEKDLDEERREAMSM